MKVFSYFIKHYRLGFVIFFAGFILGVLGLLGLRREARPPVDFARVQIVTALMGASPEDMEELITNKIERELKNISGIKDSSSVSSPGFSRIYLRLDLDNVDTQKTLDEIYRAVQNVPDLPTDLLESPRVIHEKAQEIPILTVAVIGPNRERKRNRRAWELKSRLENLPNVSRVVLEGFRNREFQVLLDPQKMGAQSISLGEVVRAVRKRSQNVSAGTLRSEKENSFVKLRAKLLRAGPLKDVVVRSNFSGQKILIKDIAKVRDGEEDQETAVIVNGQSATVLNIVKKEKTDSIKTVKKIKTAVAQYKKNLTEGLDIIYLNDESKTSKKRLNIVTNNALTGLALVLLLLWLCLPGGLGVVTALSLPFSLLSTVALLSTMGITFNVITMCAFIICIGMLVDNAIVIGENYVQFRQRGEDSTSSALGAVREMAGPVLATTITTVFAFLPMLITKGVMGQFIRWIPIVVSLALVVSLLEAFFLLPCRLSLTSPARAQKPPSPGFVRIRKKFESFILKAVERKYLSLGLIFCFLLISLVVGIKGNRFVLFPKENIEVYQAFFEVKKGSPLLLFRQKTLKLEKQILNAVGEQNVEYTFASIDRPGAKGSIYVRIHEDRAIRWKTQEVLKKLRALEGEGFTKLRFSALRPGPPVGRPVELILFSHNPEYLQKAFSEVWVKLLGKEGLIAVENNLEYSGPEYAVRPDVSALARMGLSVEEAGRALRTALAGGLAGELTQHGEKFYIRVKYNNKGRSSLELLKNISVSAPGGRLIPLSSALEWEQDPRGAEIKKHYGFKPAVTIFADVDESQTTAVLANMEVKKVVESVLSKYPSVSYKPAGERETVKESLSSLFKAMILLVFAIFSVLLVMFNSFLIAGLILSNVLLGFIGISWAFFLHFKPLSFFAMIGAVGLAGVVINSAIVLIGCIEGMRKRYPNKELKEVLALSAGRRLRPIFITTVTTVLGLFPTAYGLGGADRVLIPITLALTWGLISGTFLTLIWTPCGYAVIQDLSRRFKQTRKQNTETEHKNRRQK